MKEGKKITTVSAGGTEEDRSHSEVLHVEQILK